MSWQARGVALGSPERRQQTVTSQSLPLGGGVLGLRHPLGSSYREGLENAGGDVFLWGDRVPHRQVTGHLMMVTRYPTWSELPSIEGRLPQLTNGETQRFRKRLSSLSEITQLLKVNSN